MMEKSKQNQSESEGEDLDIDDNVGLTHDELNEIVDNIDFKEIDSLEAVTELPKEEIEAVDFNSSLANQATSQEPSVEEIASADLTPVSENEDTLIKEDNDNLPLDSTDEIAIENQKENNESSAAADQTPIALSKEELTKLEKNIDNINSTFDDENKDGEVKEKKIVKKKNKTKSEKPLKKSKSLPINHKEMKELLLFLDKQLAFIPEKKIEEFVKSKHYPFYLKLISSFKH